MTGMTWFFSRARLVVSPRHAQWLHALAGQGDAYRDHALVWKLFPGDAMQRDFVFRCDRTPAGEHVYYIVSARKPVAEASLFSVQTKPYFPQLQAGEVIRFDLRANPTVTRRIEGKPSRRHDVLMDAKRAAATSENVAQAIEDAGLRWLDERSATLGMQLASGSVLQSAYAQHALKRKQEVIQFSSLDYQGVATVIDPLVLRQALFQGVGHARGFGCGLLLVQRLS